MTRLLALCVFALCACVLFASVSADVPADLIASIPGFGKTPSKQYSGHIAADANNTVFLHYWFVTSTGNPATDPVVVWMNGGPGCSSLEGGLYELGPFTFTGAEANGVPTMVANPNAWTTVANVLFLEQPAGVGFSYAVNGSTVSNDWIQSQNTYGFLLNWFKAYPEFAKNDFYVTGESYAGIYVPTLAYRIYEGNKAGKAMINLKGAAIGNGCWGDDVGTCSGTPDSDRIAITFYYGHGMVSQTTWNAIIANCGPYWNATNDECQKAQADAMGNVGNIDVYDVYDVCNDGLSPAPPAQLRAPSGFEQKRQSVGDAVQCLNSELGRDFMNNAEVRKAFHVDQVNLTEWETCYNIDYTPTIPDERPMYREMIDSGINILIYNGDADACVPWVGNEEWTRSMQYPVTDAWRPWMVSAAGREWTGGFVTSYGKNFHFLTIKHAGHMVPQYEPEAAITFFTRFIQGKPF